MTDVNPKPALSLVGADTSKAYDCAVKLEGFSAYYGQNCVVSNIDMNLPRKGVTCLMARSGTGKSTILRWLNRINEETESASFTGQLNVLGKDVLTGYPDVTALRRRVGMVFQRPCVFPCSIYDNMVMGMERRMRRKPEMRQAVERALKAAALWDEISHRLDSPAQSLSLGQQQRLCLARALILNPEILLLDEPTASIDPVSSRAIEDGVIALGKDISVIMVTHNIAQAKRVADHVIFLCDGKIVEQGPKAHMFSYRSSDKTRTYITEEFCDC